MASFEVTEVKLGEEEYPRHFSGSTWAGFIWVLVKIFFVFDFFEFFKGFSGLYF